MPQLNNQDLYRAVHDVALALFRSQDPLVTACHCVKNSGDPLYRYVQYRNDLAQEEQAGRTVWNDLDNDTGNRWTGTDLNGNGRQGLYLSEERPGELDTDFPELTHYQDPEKPAETVIYYYEYRKGSPPKWTEARVGELRTMFLFTLDRPLDGLDLTYDRSAGLLDAIFARVKKNHPKLIDGNVTVHDLYTAPEDASFARAVGNAALEAGYPFFRTTSVRGDSVNVVIGAQTRELVDVLKPRGRASFFVQDKRTSAVVTVDDMVYNDSIGSATDDVIPLTDLRTDLKPLHDEAVQVGGNIDWSDAAAKVDGSIADAVRQALESDPSLYDVRSVDEVVHRVDGPELRRAVTDDFTTHVVASATLHQDPHYDGVVQAVSVEGAHTLVKSAVAQPKTAAATTYLTAAIGAEFLGDSAHHFQETAGNLQQKLADLAKDQEKTAGEVEATRQAVHENQVKLDQHPDDPDLRREKEELAKKLGDLVDRQRKQQDDAAKAEREKEAADRAGHESEEAARDADGRRDEEGEHVFGKGNTS